MDIADLFLEIYDDLCDVNITELADLRVAALHASTAIFDTAVRTGDYPRPGTDDPEQLLAVMLGLHRALIYADPDRDVPDKRGMALYAARYDATHMLTEDTSNGTLVFTRAIAGRPNAADDADRHEDLVPGLLRVTKSILVKIDFRVAPALLDLRVSDSRAALDDQLVGTPELRVAQLPFLSSSSDVKWERITDPKGTGKDAYAVDPVSQNLIPRVAQALEALDQSGCPLALLPEAALDDDLLAAWVAALRKPARPVGLQWILVGTGPVTAMGNAVLPKPPRPNRAVVLSSDGELIFTQDKRAGFTLDAIQIKRYELSEKLGTNGPLNEYIRKGSRLTVIDNSSGRFAIAICEDHGRVIENGHLSQAIGLTHLLVPVIAPAMWSGGWQSSAAQTLASGCGISVAVSNSIAINQQGQDASGTTTGPAPTLCVVRAPHEGPVVSHGVVSWEMKAHPGPLADPVEDSLTVRTTTL